MAHMMCSIRVNLSFGLQPETVTRHTTIIAAIVLVVILIILVTSIYFGYKCYILRKHKVVYRYSLLNQTAGNDGDEGIENALEPRSAVYQDSSDDEELNSPAVKTKPSNGKRSYSSTANGNPFGSYHDDSDVDMLA